MPTLHVIHVVCAIYTIADKCTIYDSVHGAILALVRTSSGSHGREPFIGKIEVIFGLFVDIVGIFDFRYTERRHEECSSYHYDMMKSIFYSPTKIVIYVFILFTARYIFADPVIEITLY